MNTLNSPESWQEFTLGVHGNSDVTVHRRIQRSLCAKRSFSVPGEHLQNLLLVLFCARTVHFAG